MDTKFIFVTGGVVSSLGKGIATSSIGAILKSMNFSVILKKLDPYLNVDSGTMNPQQHGEVFVTSDGIEADLDLGHYERFTDIETSFLNTLTSGKVYKKLLENERKGKYLGSTVQTIPHVTDLIKEFIYEASQEVDFVICEIGGTVGDIEALPFFESIRQMKQELKEKVIFVHLTYIPYLQHSREIKTKPTQHSVKELMSIGIMPDILLCRSSISIGYENIRKISNFCNVDETCVIEALDAKSIYEIPLMYIKHNVHKVLMQKFQICNYNPPLLLDFENFIKKKSQAISSIKVALIGKYNTNGDSYKSVIESIEHACIAQGYLMELIEIDSKLFDSTIPNLEDLKGAKCIVIPGGFGKDGLQGKINFIQFARENNVPILGICLGMQMMTLEIARNLCGILDAVSEEFSNIGNKVIGLISTFEKNGKIEERSSVTDLGGTMRLGSYISNIEPNTLASKLYEKTEISERHRHRYEVDINLKDQFFKKGVIFSSTSKNGKLPEVIEMINHKFFIGCQYHPEFKSRLFSPHPLFIGLIKAAI